jgi:uncharacterized protein (TIGR00297 family)
LKLLLLDAAGTLVAIAMGATVYYFGGAYGWPYLALILAFLVSSVAATKYQSSVKRKLALYEYSRSWENVVANGIVSVFCVLLAYWFGEGVSGLPYGREGVFVGAFVGSLAAVTADKFSSEIGVLGKEPRRLFDFKLAKRGESGAISLLGTLAAFNGALVIAIASYLIFQGKYDAWGVLFISIIGVVGSLIDSVVGVYETRGFGNKMTTNIICAISGALMGYFFL